MTTGPDLERLGRAIRLYRDITNLTQDEIAQRGGPSDVTIRGLENVNGKKPNGATLRKIDRGLKWPEGFAAKLLEGEAELYDDIDPEGGRMPNFMDFTTDPMRDAPPPTEEDMESSYASWIAERPIYEQSTSDLITELAGRYRDQEQRLRRLEQEREALQARVAQMLRDDSADPPTRHLSAVPGTLSRDDREELYRRAEQVDLSRESFAAADPEDDSDDDESV